MLQPQEIDILHQKLLQKRHPFDGSYDKLTSLVNPFSSLNESGYSSEATSDTRFKYKDMYSSIPIQALKSLSSGLASGATPPTRPWFLLKLVDDSGRSTRDEVLQEYGFNLSKKIHKLFNNTNVYGALELIYKNVALYGTSCALLVPDEVYGFRLEVLPIKSYVISENTKNEVDLMIRCYDDTVRNIRDNSDFEHIPRPIQSDIDNNRLEETYKIIHAIIPNTEAGSDVNFDTIYYVDYGSRGNYSSGIHPTATSYNYSTQDSDKDNDRVLGRGTYELNPILAPRWASIAGSSYGVGVGMDAYGDINQLQYLTDLVNKLIQSQATPALQTDSSTAGRDGISLIPGAVTITGAIDSKIAPIIPNPLDPSRIYPQIEQIVNSINKLFHVDLFRHFIREDTHTMTATEVMQRQSEIAVMLGSVLDRLHRELLRPLVMHAVATRNEWMKDVDQTNIETISSGNFHIDFISMLAVSQASYEQMDILKFVQLVGQIASFSPTALDILDFDEMVRILADLGNIDTKIIKSEELVNAIRDARMRQQQQMMLMQMQQAQAQAQKTTAEATKAAAQAGAESNII